MVVDGMDTEKGVGEGDEELGDCRRQEFSECVEKIMKKFSP